jgi:Holliday junction resolvase
MEAHHMTEQDIQAKIIKRLEAQGYFVLKLVQTNKTGIPDLLATKPNEARWIEVKRPGKKPSAVQEYRHNELRSLGYSVEVLDA